MRSLLGRFHRPMSRGLVNNMLTMNNLGDGSTLNLDFTTMGDVLDPRLTFSRASTATFVNSSGYVEWAGANLCPYSQQINVGTWLVGVSATLTPNTTDVLDPQGGNTATKIALGANTYNSRAMSLALPGGMTYTFSYWIRGTAGNQSRIYSNAGYVGDLVTQIPYSYSTTEWTRVSITFTTNVATTNVFIYVCSKPTLPATTDVIYVWGAQLNPGSTAQTYYPTTTAAYHAPRFDYSPTNIGQPRGLLVEGQGVNLLVQSNDWNTTWNNPAQITWNGSTYATAPDNTNTAKQITVTAASSSAIGQAVSTGTNRTISVWLRGGSLTSFSIGAFDAGGTSWGNNPDSTSSIISGPGSVTQQVGGLWSITGLSTTQWTRIRIFRSSTYTTFLAYPGASSGTINGTAFMWGMQMEAGSDASSYIPTGASQVTRAVDTAIIAAGTNFSSWYTGGTTGTFVTEWCRCTATTTQRTVIATSDVSNQHLHQYIAATTSRLRLADKVPAFIETANASVDNSINKGAFSYAGSLQSLCLNGGTVVPGTLTFTTAPTWLSIGGPSTNGTSITDTAVVLNNAIRTIKYYPTRLTDAQIKDITT